MQEDNIKLMKIDAHQHFWKFDPVQDTWITNDMAVLQRDYTPSDLESLLSAHGFSGCVAVQADQAEAETYYLADLAKQHDWIKGVVGWVDLRSDRLQASLDQISELPSVKGFRHIIQSEPDGFMRQPAFIEGLRQLESYDFTYDILIYEQQLEEVITLVDLLSENQKLVIDHIAKPIIREKSFTTWEKYIRQLAKRPNTRIKVSGLVTEADWQHWQQSDFQPYLSTVLDAFGPHRMMFGSDWPVCLLAAQYEQVVSVIQDFVNPLSATEQAAIMGQTAVDFYQLSD
ncbi:amidohydrolase family protein [Tunicatimonas pelagia]|uniref:amidohydrolase family protein n=1 Tax=Tunicatimonas pelagia TaxID=931531 RepID=UPI0026664BCC|nr:amidohydrolase family protein [Tunicatimonas pelagia]WKN44141.1 amidohydrolase family protein [Tunicatimonas pelagia]